MKHKVFFSFHYKPDNSRAAQVRNIGVVDGNRPTTDNDWEKIKKGGDRAIKLWISKQMNRRTCTVVLVGSDTYRQPWVKYEICKSWDDGMGVVGIRIHDLKDLHGLVSQKGQNPFDLVRFSDTGKVMSSVVKCYNPEGRSSQERYAWIAKHLSDSVEEAITIRNQN